MRILYVVTRALEINTSASVRNHATISGLVANGHKVTLFSSEPDVNHKAYDKSLRPNGVETHYVKLGGTQSIARLGNKFTFLNRLKPFVSKIRNKSNIYDNMKSIVSYTSDVDLNEYDLIISSSDPKSSHLFVYELLRMSDKKVPWIQIWGDPFADDITLTNKKKFRQVECEEEKLLQVADRIIYVSELTKISQQNRYPQSASKMIYLPIPYAKPRVEEKRFPQKPEEYRYCYCGDYNSNVRNLLPFYQAIRKLKVNAVICGMSDRPVENTDQIQVLPRQTAEQVRRYESEADVLIHLSNLKGTQIPGKIYQYASTDKPVIFITDGNAAALKNTFEKYNRFIFVDNAEENIEDVLLRIDTLVKMTNNNPIQDFSANVIASKITQGLE